MDFSSYPSELIIAGSYSSASKRDLVDPKLSGFPLADDWRVHDLLENTGQNSTSSPSPWTMHGLHMSPVMFQSYAGPHHPYVPSESSLSVPYSSADSAHNGIHDWESHRDPSTPGEVAAFSPTNDPDPVPQGEGYMSQLPFNGLEGPSNFHQVSGCSAYDNEAYSFSTRQEPSGILAFHQSFSPFIHGSGAISSMTDSDIGSPSPSLLPTASYTALDTLSPAEEKELASNRKSSPVASRATRSAHKAPKATAKSTKGQSKVSKPNNKALHNRASSKSSKPTSCVQCQTSYQDCAALEKHIKTAHTRPFICVFHYAGCTSTFATKNEWKRHVSSQHLYLEYYHCDHEECATAKPTSARRRPKNLPQFGGIFNRKDLFTQHVRRMHLPEDKKKKPSREAEESIKQLQDRALNRRCDLPKHMYCPAVRCNEQFIGDKAWDDRMEHVARHLERAATGEEEPVTFGGLHDRSLSAWVESPQVDVVRRCFDGTWKLNNPIKGGDPDNDGSDASTFDEDAEGEEC